MTHQQMRFCDAFRGKRNQPRTGAWFFLLLCSLLGFTAGAQQLTGTISGTAYDQSGAAVPKASVQLKNEASGDLRTSVTDKTGHFAITGVQPANYTLSVTATGFSRSGAS